MKRLVFTSVLFLMSILFVHAQDYLDISGHVTNIDNGDPVANHEVFVSLNDSIGFFVFLTDQNGYYGDTIYIGGSNATSVYIYTFDCTYAIHDTTVTDLNSPIDADFEICDSVSGGQCFASYYYLPDSTNWKLIHFTDMSYTPTGNITSWDWDFGDGTTSTEQNPSHEYSNEDEYNVCLTIEASDGCQNTFCMDVFVQEIPPIDCENYFTYTTNDYITYEFTGEVSPQGNATYEWDFGDGYTASGKTVTHTFETGGINMYMVCLQTTSLDSIGDSCMAISCQEIFVGNQGYCEAMYSYFPDSSIYTIHFMDVSWGNPTSWLWEFGDGTSSTEKNPTHTYNDLGTYSVCLTIEGDSCSDTFCDSVWIGNMPGDCFANFFYYPDSSDYLTYHFMDMSFTPFGQASTWYWDFGDGNSSTEQNPSHTYVESGVYYVCLTITDSTTNCENTFCLDVFVYGPGDCVAQYIYFPFDSIGGNNTLSYQFLDASMGYPTSWDWDFGDGTTSGEQNPIHTFPDFGTYYVSLTISNDSCTDTFADSVYVGLWPGDCYSWFDFVPTDLTVDFTGYTYSQYATTYNWDFGDGTTASGQQVLHTYNEAGIYLVTLITEDSTGCVWTSTMEVWVGDIVIDIWGNVYVDILPVDYAEVHLMTFDTMGNNLITVETTTVDSAGYYVFEDVEVNNWNVYFVQAELTDQSIYYGTYLPTYHLSSLYWEFAFPIFPCPAGGYDYDIWMIPTTTYSTGNGMIEGIVNSEETRGILEDVEMLLLDQVHNPINYIRTNEEGLFDFSTLAYGTYYVRPEMVGVHATPFKVTLSEENPVASLDIIIKNHIATLSVDEINSNYIGEVGDIFPNPIHENSKIEMTLKQKSEIEVSIFNSTGQMVNKYSVSKSSGKVFIDLKTNALRNGFYTLKMQTEDGSCIIRKFVKLN